MRWYGVAGIILILFTEINFVLKLEPFASYYFPIVWFGYIFLIDALVFKIKGKSLLNNHKHKFFALLALSAIVWWMFELINLKLGNWVYAGGIEKGFILHLIFRTVSFSTVIPAVFETGDLIKEMHMFDKLEFHKKHNITRGFLFGMILFGVLSLFLSLMIPKLFFPFIWLSMFFILDPINYMNKQSSIIQHLKDRKLKIPITLMFAGLVCGILWEFWNYWAQIKWYYFVPYVNFLKIFEMPILGYFGYLPFALELYVIYHFGKWVWKTL